MSKPFRTDEQLMKEATRSQQRHVAVRQLMAEMSAVDGLARSADHTGASVAETVKEAFAKHDEACAVVKRRERGDSAVANLPELKRGPVICCQGDWEP